MSRFVLRHGPAFLAELEGEPAEVVLGREAQAALGFGAGVELVRMADGQVMARTDDRGGAVGWEILGV